jgi:hypothetical protein
MDENQELQREALEMYEWNESGDALVRKENHQIVATIAQRKKIWVAADKSRDRSKRIGEYDGEEAARRAINKWFGLELP